MTPVTALPMIKKPLPAPWYDLFVTVMPVGCEDEHNDFLIKDAIDHPMFLCDFTAPAPLGLTL